MKRFLIKLPRPSLYVFISALLIVLAFAPWDLSFLIWFALVPFLIELSRARTIKAAALHGFWLSFLEFMLL